MPEYPRVCRNGHVIAGPDDEHHGAHPQCWRCRRASQTEADARYDESDRGRFIRSTYESSIRRYLMARNRALLGQIEVLGEQLQEMNDDLRAAGHEPTMADDYGDVSAKVRASEPPPMSRVHEHRRIIEMIARCGGLDMYAVRLASGL